jgi:hypothetical protein
MDGWDIALLAVAGFVAATALVRLMIRRRNQLVSQLLAESQRQPLQKPPSKSPPQEGA